MFPEPSKEKSATEIERDLYKKGLEEYEVELFMLRFIEGRKMQEIVDTQGWVSVSSASYHLKKTVAKIRRGWK